MEDLLEIIFFVVVVVVGGIIKVLSGSKNGGIDDDTALETRLEDAIRKAKEQVEGRKVVRTPPPPVAPVPPRLQPKPVPMGGTPRNQPRPASPPPIPMRPAATEPRAESPKPAPAAARMPESPAAAVLESKPMPATPNRVPVKTEAALHQEKFDKLMSMDAYELPGEMRRPARKAKAAATKERPGRKHSPLREMVVHAEILSPPRALRRFAAFAPRAMR